MMRYRLIVSLLAAVVLVTRGKARLTAPGGETSARHVWLHGASNGELSSVRPVLERMIAARPDLHWLVTTNTETGRDMVAGWGLPRVEAQLAPLDLGWLTRQVLKRRNVIAHITLEAELWPHRVMQTPGPVVILGARMSAGTARGWARLGRLAQAVLGQVAWVSAQDDASLDRLGALGLPSAARGPVVDMKSFYTPVDVTPPQGIDRESTWLAASTHAGEEDIVLDAHLAARKAEPGLRLILAPRHPRRAAEIRGLIEARGLSVGQRSMGDAPDQGEVYLADTMGEMPLWYSACGRVFIAGSLTDRGGHTPYEPAAYGAALIHGPDLRNFAAAYGRLTAAQAARAVTVDAVALAAAVTSLRAPEEQHRMAQAASQALRGQAGPEVLAEAVLRLLPPA